MSGKYDEAKKVFSLAMFSYLGNNLTGTVAGNRRKVAKRLKETFDEEGMRSRLGDWKVVWGPCIFQPDKEFDVIGNLMYIAKSEQDGVPQYVIAISGTNPMSFYALTMNFRVNKQVDWLPKFPPYCVNGKISKGANIGFRKLKSMKPSEGPGKGQNIKNFLKNEFKVQKLRVKKPQVIITGHSLGGMLAPTVASWLRNEQNSWDPDNMGNLTLYTFGAGTTGNKEFADYVTKVQFKGKVFRVWNKLEISPPLFNATAMKGLPKIYTPYIKPNEFIRELYNFFENCRNGNCYCQIKKNAKPFANSAINRSIIKGYPFIDYIKQAGYQHIEAYFKLTGTTYIWRNKMREYFMPIGANEANDDLTKLENKIKSFCK